MLLDVETLFRAITCLINPVQITCSTPRSRCCESRHTFIHDDDLPVRHKAAERLPTGRFSLYFTIHGIEKSSHPSTLHICTPFAVVTFIHQAVEEYRRVLDSPSAEHAEKQEVLVRCEHLLRKIGRSGEADQFREAHRSKATGEIAG